MKDISKRKLLILTNCVLEYRIAVYNLLSETFNVTVAHYGKRVDNDKTRFKQIMLTARKRGSFIILKENIKLLASQFDAVLAMGDLHCLSYLRLGSIRKRSFSLTFWSIGVSASHNKRFDEDRKLDWIRFKLMNTADSIVFYTDYPINRYVNDGGIEKAKLFVAYNTVEIQEKVKVPTNKKYFLFVGTLYKAKKIFDLLNAYLLAYNFDQSIQSLLIIGDGEEKINIEIWIQENHLQDKITLTGAIFNQDVLRKFYQDAIACISPGQAGLTVLNSMAYGVPFVTTKNAITGGEIFNIKNEINGIIYEESIEQLSEILLDLSQNPDKVHNLSLNAQDYFYNNRTIPTMIQGLIDSVMYAISKRNK